MAGIRLEWAQFGDFDSFDVIRSDTSLANIADDDLPSAIATNLKTMYYADTMVEMGNTYYYKVRVWRSNIALMSDEVSCLAVSGDQFYKNVILLMHFNNSFIDEVSRTDLEKFGTVDFVNGEFDKAAQFTASTGNNYLRAANIDGRFNFTEKFTIEFTIKHTEAIATYKNILVCGQASSPNGLAIWVNNGRIVVAQAYGSEFLISNTVLNRVDVYKIAVTRDEINQVKLFINGILDAQETSNINFSFNNDYLHVGNFPNGGGGIGWIDELRITKGICRYKTNYNIAEAEFKNY